MVRSEEDRPRVRQRADHPRRHPRDGRRGAADWTGGGSVHRSQNPGAVRGQHEARIHLPTSQEHQTGRHALRPHVRRHHRLDQHQRLGERQRPVLPAVARRGRVAGHGRHRERHGKFILVFWLFWLSYVWAILLTSCFVHRRSKKPDSAAAAVSAPKAYRRAACPRSSRTRTTTGVTCLGSART